MGEFAADAIVVGGGAIGCATAYELKRAGLDVLLLERSTLASEASGANGAQLVQSDLPLGQPLELVVESHRLLDRAADELDYGFDLTRPGRLVVALNEADWQQAAELVRRRREAGYPIELVDDAGAHELEPFLGNEVVGGAYCPNDGRVNPFLLTHAYAASARRLGARIRLGVEVLNLNRDRDRVTGVETRDGRYSADVVILANGAWAKQVAASAGLVVPVYPGHGEMIVTEPAEFRLSVVLRSSSIGVNQTSVGSLLIGSTVEFKGFEKDVDIAPLCSFAVLASRMLPVLAGCRALRFWAGLRPMTPDGLPIVDRYPGIEGVILAVGHGTRGMSWVPITARLVTHVALNGTLPTGSECVAYRPMHVS